jgi:2-oxoisovalerate dehydrogenase E2 component (dihydrolipoyl transacylase)
VPTFKQFRLPDAGEGLTEAEILKWYVQIGDLVTVNQALVEIETAKAAVELPSPFAGVITELLVPEGATVDVGTPIVTVDVDPDGALGAPASVQAQTLEDIPSPPGDAPVEPGLIGSPAPGGRTAVLVGYGPRTVAAKRRPRKGGPAGPAGTAPGAGSAAAGVSANLAGAGSDAVAYAGGPGVVAAAEGAPAEAATAAAFGADPVAAPRGPSIAAGAATSTFPAPVGAAPAPAGSAPAAQAGPAAAGASGAAGGRVAVLAKPPVRKLARDLGVDLAAVSGSGEGGVITRGDVEAAAHAGTGPEPAPAAAAPVAVAAVAPAVWDASREQRIPIKGVRKHTAAAMVASAFTAPHVTEWLTLDMTPTMELRDRVAALPEFAGIKVSPLLFVARAVLLAIRRNPMINSAWDEQAQEIVVKEYVNLGIAAATPRGLIVPNVKDAGRLSLQELALALKELTDTARAGRTAPADMSGGTFTITNVGVFGVDGGTPILNPGETAILALGTVRDMPWVVDGQLAIRKITQLSLSFDHRIVDGQLGSQFLSDLGAILADPSLAIAWG